MPTDKQDIRNVFSRDDLCHHLGIERSTLKGVTEHFELHLHFNRQFHWRDICRAIHDTNGGLLASHYDALCKSYPDCEELLALGDLELRLQEPLWAFAEMATCLGYKPDTLRRALKENRFRLPFPEIQLGPRLRRYRRFEVILWRDTGLQLELPSAPEYLVPKQAPQPARRAHMTGTANAFFGRFVQKK